MLPPERADEAGRLREAAAELNLVLPEAAPESLVTFLDLLDRWNATYNLTAVRGRSAMVSQHLVDCLAVVPPLARQAREHAAILDVGSGGGLPGVVLAILRPGWRVTCVDTVAKKVAFLRQVAATLALPNLTAIHARVESLRTPQFDVITSRAFASLADFVRWTRPSLAPTGVWMAMKGRRPDDEIAQLPSDVEVFHVEPLSVPGLEAERCLVWMRPR